MAFLLHRPESIFRRSGYRFGAENATILPTRLVAKVQHALDLDRALVVVELAARDEFDVGAQRHRIAHAPRHLLTQLRASCVVRAVVRALDADRELIHRTLVTPEHDLELA